MRLFSTLCERNAKKFFRKYSPKYDQNPFSLQRTKMRPNLTLLSLRGCLKAYLPKKNRLMGFLAIENPNILEISYAFFMSLCLK